MSSHSQPDHHRFRILLYRENGKDLLLEHNDQGFALPSILIPPYTRIAQQITEAIRNDWKLQTSCLFSIGDPPARVYAVELCDAGHTRPANGNWLRAHTLTERDFREATDFDAIEIATKLFDQYRRSPTAGPFGKLGWFQDVARWVQSKAAPLGLHLTGEFKQLNASATFSLIRFATDGPALWLKAVGEPNLREYPITLALASNFPHFVACIIAVREDWHAWLATEAPGQPLDTTSAFSGWLKASVALANLQVASMGQSLCLLNAGCSDIRVGSLVHEVSPFFEVMAEFMEQQTKKTPAPLTGSELETLRLHLEEALSILDHSNIPDALGHLDLNPGNVVVSDDNCIFLDWAQAYVGHPFLTFQYLSEYLRSLRPAEECWQHRLLARYLEPWRCFGEQKDLIETAAAIPLAAAFAYAVGGTAWTNKSHRQRSETTAWFRSLTRRMKREADYWQTSRARPGMPCFS